MIGRTRSRRRPPTTRDDQGAVLLLTIVLEVFLMTYVLMPRITRWFARWIYPS